MNPKCLKYMVWLLLWLMGGCTKEESPLNETPTGALTLQVSTGAPTRAQSPGDGNLYDGGGMEDLTLVLVNPNNRVAAIQRLTNLTGQEQLIREVTFEHLGVGNYVVYAYANTRRSYLDEAETLLSSLSEGSNFGAAQRDALFTTLTGRTAPETSPTQPLLLTASQEVKIEMGISTASIVMIRPVVRFEVKLHNHSTYPLRITDFSTSNFNPSTGYLIPHNGAIPQSVSYRALPTYDTFTGGTDIEVAANTEEVIYRTELFENRAPSYTLNLSLESKIESTGYQITQQTSLKTNTQYALQNVYSGRYLVDNNGSLGLVNSLSEAASLEHALWTFSSTSSGYLTNVATGNHFHRNTQANTGTNHSLTFSNRGGGVFWIYYSTSYLNDNNGKAQYGLVYNERRDWRLQTVTYGTTTTTVPYSVSNQPLYIVDKETAKESLMSEQLRNQYISVVINAYYSDVLGSFRFEVSPWTEKNEEVEFN